MVRVMCYDMYSLSGSAVGPVSMQPWAKDAMQYWMRHVPREKLIMGLPAYSGDFQLAVSRVLHLTGHASPNGPRDIVNA